MTKHDQGGGEKTYPRAVRMLGYLFIQAALLMLVKQMPWPVVDVLVFIATVRRSAVPDPVSALFWMQAVVGLFLPVRGKVFLIAQFAVFVLAFLSFAEVQHRSNVGDRAELSNAVATIYWVQFFVTAVGFLGWQYRRSRIGRWYSLFGYFALQLSGLWVVTQIRWPGADDLRGWVIVAFCGGSFALLGVASRIRLIVAAEILLAVSLVQIPNWLRTASYHRQDSISDLLWIMYVLQCAGLSWWLYRKTRKTQPPMQ